jgi:hypothetical protein
MQSEIAASVASGKSDLDRLAKDRHRQQSALLERCAFKLSNGRLDFDRRVHSGRHRWGVPCVYRDAANRWLMMIGR